MPRFPPPQDIALIGREGAQAPIGGLPPEAREAARKKILETLGKAMSEALSARA